MTEQASPAHSGDWVVILNYGLAGFCIERLRALGGDGRFGLLFVDNASPPADRAELSEAVRAHDGVVFGEAESADPARLGERLRTLGGRCALLSSAANLGYSGGNNLGLRALRAAFGEDLRCVVLNPDVDVSAAQIVELLNHSADIVGPAIHEDYLNGLRAYEDNCDFSTGFCENPGRVPTERLGVRLCGCCFKLSGAALARYGYLPEECFLYDEETFYFARVWHAGGRPAYLPGVVVRHAGSAAEGKKGFNYFYYIFRNRLLYFRREAAPRGASRLRFAQRYFAWWRAVLLRQLRTRNLNGARGVVMGLVDGLRGRSGRYVA